MAKSVNQTQQQFGVIATTLEGEPGVTVGSKTKKGFGSGALQVNGKIFAMVSSAGGFVVKLPKQRVQALESEGCGQRFDPGHGRLMKEWLVVREDALEQWLPLAREALHFVRQA